MLKKFLFSLLAAMSLSLVAPSPASATNPSGNDQYEIEIIYDRKTGDTIYILYKNGVEVQRIVKKLEKNEGED